MDKNPRDPVQWQGECLVFWKLKNLVGVLPFQGIAVAAPYANRRTNISWSHHAKGLISRSAIASKMRWLKEINMDISHLGGRPLIEWSGKLVLIGRLNPILKSEGKDYIVTLISCPVNN